MKIYIDHPWSEDVKKWGAPMRIYLHTKHWMWTIGLWPTIKSQAWNGTTGWGYTDDPPDMRWITWHPKGNLHPAEVCGTPITNVYITKDQR